MTDSPLVSVLMTAYNREKYIEFAIESVLASSYRHWELIVVDDISSDNTLSIVRRYAEKDSRIRLYINEKNLGDYPNRNQAAAYANGKYLKYVDADDYIYPWGLELLVQMMEEFPEAGWGLCSLLQVPAKPYPFLLNSKEAYEHHYSGQDIFNKAPLSAIFRRDAFLEAGGFTALRMVGDCDMWHKMALLFPVLLMPDGMVWYREHEEQEMSYYNKFIVRYEEVRMKYLRDPRCPLASSRVKDIIRKKRRSLARSAFNSLIRFRLSGASGNFKAWLFYLGK